MKLQEWLSLIKSIITRMKGSGVAADEEDEEREAAGDNSRKENALLFRRAKSAQAAVACGPQRVISECLTDSNPEEKLDQFAQQLNNVPIPPGRPRSGRRARRTESFRSHQKSGSLSAGTIRKGSNYHKEPESRRLSSAGTSRGRTITLFLYKNFNWVFR